jgi:F0F1-type ATP synthase assembly protein I
MPKKSWPVLVGEYTSLAFMLPVCTMVGFAIGYLLDGQFGTSWVRFAGLVVGIVAGFVQLIRQLMRDTKDDAE